MTTELILIRHGHAVRVNGDYHNAPLTRLGKEQAEKTAHYFNQRENHVDALYASPLRRAQETAHIIGEITGHDVSTRQGIEEARLAEVLVLLFYQLISTSKPVDRYLLRNAGKLIHWPVAGRVSRVMLDILKNHPEGGRIGVVAHAGVISAGLSWLLPARRWRWWRTTVSNCSITRFQLSDGRVDLLGVNEVTHLEPALVSTQPPTPAVEIANESRPPTMEPAPDTPAEKDILPK